MCIWNILQYFFNSVEDSIDNATLETPLLMNYCLSIKKYINIYYIYCIKLHLFLYDHRNNKNVIF